MEEKIEDAIILRPHHLMCLPRFRGEGYSKEFISKAEDLVARLQSDRAQVILVRGADDLCNNCPLMEECEGGDAHELADSLDQSILDATRLPIGMEIPAREALEKVARAFSTVEAVCQGCQWLDTCLRIEKTWK
ncbi:MAG: DUF1284 domain-containing protein [Candidatus Thermoplasmatota archaeon]|nr:DUF1284 domain-containing protein [Candidatus Thermoplasmatota archaeon]